MLIRISGVTRVGEIKRILTSSPTLSVRLRISASITPRNTDDTFDIIRL